MNQSVKINGNELHLDKSAIISMTKRIANIGTLERQSSFTNKLDLPATAVNLSACGLVQGSDASILKYSRQIGQVKSNGIEVMNAAEFTIESIQDRISILINADNSVFFDKISKLRLRELDLSDLDHVWCMQSEYDSIPNDWNDGYIYPIHDTGNQSRSINNLQCAGVVPHVFAKYIFKKIADNFGYTMEGAWWEHPMFELIMVSITEARTGTRLQQQVQVTATKTTNQTFGLLFNTWTKVTAWDSATTDVWDVWNNNSPSGYEVKFPGKYTFKVRFESDIAKGFPADPLNIVEARFRIRCYQIDDGGATVTVLGQTEIFQTSVGAFDNEIDVSISLEAIRPESQDSNVYCIFEAYQRGGATGSPSDPYYNTVLTVDYARFSVEYIDAEFTHYNRPINIQESLPDWTCGKFIKEICNIAGVIPVVNDWDKKIRLMMLNEIAANKPVARKWQSIMDLSTKPNYTFKVDGYGRVMNLRWKQDERYGYSISVNNEQLPEKLDYIKSDFNWCAPTLILGKNWFCSQFNIWDSEKGYIKFDKNCYISLLQRRTGHVTYTSPNETNLNAAGGTSFPWAYFQAQGSLPYNLQWQFLYETFYKDLLSGIIDQIMQVEIDFRLDEFDINDFDFSIPIYLQNPSGYYFVQQLKDFTTSQQSTSVELIRIG